MSRGFEIAKGWEDKDIKLPVRATEYSAGYDFECAEDIIIPSIVSSLIRKPTLVPTGIKAYMNNDEGLFLYNRSGNPLKNFLVLANGVGVIDADYYGNPDNDGHIMFQFYNLSPLPLTIKKGQRVGQGVFKNYLKVDNDNSEEKRTGGMGSTN